MPDSGQITQKSIQTSGFQFGFTGSTLEENIRANTQGSCDRKKITIVLSQFYLDFTLSVLQLFVKSDCFT